MASKTTDRAVSEWATQVRASMSDRVRGLIFLARQDLWSGPLQDVDPADWPGFMVACREIREALSDAPSEVWVDVESGCVQDSEPEGYLDPEDGWQEPEWADLVHLEGRAVLSALVGELARYVA